MNLRAGCVVSAGLLLTTAAHAEILTPRQAGKSPYLRQVSDFVEPYVALPSQLPPPRYARVLLPLQEVYTVLRESGFSPLGAPRLRGNVWTIAAISRDGEDGRLFIDATSGRILNFMPADYDVAPDLSYGPQAAPPRPPMPPMPPVRALERPPAAIPHVASRAVPVPQPVTPLPPMPKPVPPAAAARPVAPAPAQSTAAEPPPPVAAPAAPLPSTVGQARPVPQILPTQDMPKVQDLEF